MHGAGAALDAVDDRHPRQDHRHLVLRVAVGRDVVAGGHLGDVDVRVSVEAVGDDLEQDGMALADRLQVTIGRAEDA